MELSTYDDRIIKCYDFFETDKEIFYVNERCDQDLAKF